jgi:hypothetical protein
MPIGLGGRSDAAMKCFSQLLFDRIARWPSGSSATDITDLLASTSRLVAVSST